jgi:type VI secretion system protein ImpM
MPSSDASGDPLALCALYGKLPSVGDFISRRMSYGLQQFWDRWCAMGLDALRHSRPDGQLGAWHEGPMWAFLLPQQPGISICQMGVLAPSQDRVGRQFPFVVSAGAPVDQIQPLLTRSAALALAWSDVIEQAKLSRQPADAVDAELQSRLNGLMSQPPAEIDPEQTLPRGMQLPILPWPDLLSSFDPQGSQSYWWSVPPAATGFRALAHEGALNSSLFGAISR